jgi:hypothetical protein
LYVYVLGWRNMKRGGSREDAKDGGAQRSGNH